MSTNIHTYIPTYLRTKLYHFISFFRLGLLLSIVRYYFAVKICADTIDNCAGYAPACNDTQYRGFLEARCPAFCGYCKSYEVIQGKTVNGVK